MITNFKISGKERRKVKKELSELKSFMKSFWHEHQMEKDMSSFYGGSDMVMEDDVAKELYDKTMKQIKTLEESLKMEL